MNAFPFEIPGQLRPAGGLVTALNLSWLWLTAPSRCILATENMTWATDHLRTHSLPPESPAKAATRGQRHTLHQTTHRSYMDHPPPTHSVLAVPPPSPVKLFLPPLAHHRRTWVSNMMSVMPSSAVHIPMHLDTDRPTQDVEFSEVAASYRLQPASCQMCLVCALPSGLDATKVRAAAFAAVQNANLDLKEKALLADLEDGYALIIT
ncbi:LOW QUALITY PROTEIN: hypothetical protein ACG7TL_000414 [Trametes sanguinea]